MADSTHAHPEHAEEQPAEFRPMRPRRNPAHLSHDHLVTLPPSLREEQQPQRPMDHAGAPSVCSRISSARSVKSAISKSIAEQETRTKLEEIRRRAEQERARVEFEAAQRRIQIDSDLRQAEIHMEMERLKHELSLAEEEELHVEHGQESGGNLPGRDESVQDATQAWVNKGVRIPESSACLPAGTVASANFAGMHASAVAANHSAGLPAFATSANNLAEMPVPALPLQLSSVAAPITSQVSHGAAGVYVASSLPHTFNPNLPAFFPNTMLVQSSPTAHLFSGLPVAQPLADGGAPRTHGPNGQLLSGDNPPRQPPRGNDQNPQPPSRKADTPSSGEQSETSSTDDEDEDPSESDKGNKRSCCPKGSSKEKDRSTTPTAHAGPVTAFAGPFGYGFGIWDSLPKLDIPKFDSEHDVKQYVTFRSLWDSIMKGPMSHLPEATKFTYLRSHLGGRPLAIADRNLILGDRAYAATMKQFDRAFGEPGRIIQGLLDQLESRPVLAHNDWSGLRDFSDELATAVETAEKFEFQDELKHHRYATELVKKLPERLHTEFLSKMWDQGRGMKYTVCHLSNWLKKKTGPAGLILMEKASKSKPSKESSQWKAHSQRKAIGNQPSPSRSYLAQAGSQPDNGSSKGKDKANHGTKSPNETSSATVPPEWFTSLYCRVKESGHYLETCQKFQGLTADQKLQWLKTNQRCKKCAKKHENDCPYPKKCKECQGDHRTSLHELAKPVAKDAVLCSGIGPRPRVDYHRDVLIKVVPLTIHGSEGSIDTFGVLD